MSVERRRNLMAAASSGSVGETGVFYAPSGDLVFAQTPLVYQNDKFRFQTRWNEVCSYGSLYGKVNGSTYFSPEYGIDLNGYRLATLDEYNYIISSSRIGSTYNGTSGAQYSPVYINTEYMGNDKVKGMIIFPDGLTILGPVLRLNVNDMSGTYEKTITVSELNSLLNQGVWFIPYLGGKSSSWYGMNSSCYLYSSTKKYTNPNLSYKFSVYTWKIFAGGLDSNQYNSTFLCRNV